MQPPTQAPGADARTAGRALIAKAVETGKRPSFIYVNNWLLGNAPATVEAMLE